MRVVAALQAMVRQAVTNGQYVVLNPSTGPDAPLGWLSEAGVPNVSVCFKPPKNQTCTKDKADRTYPYYLAPAYYPLWRRYHQALHDWVAGLDKNKDGFRPVQTIQVSLGSTGDITPWHGTPVESKYAIDSATWSAFWVSGSRAMWEVHQDLLPDTKLLFNGVPTNSTPEPDNPDAKYWPAYRALIFDEIKPPNFDMKNGVISHEYMTSNEHDDYLNAGNITRWPYVNTDTGRTEFVRTRGESSDGGGTSGPGLGFWLNPTWNLLAMMCWDVTYGLDVQNPNPQMWSEEYGQQNTCPTCGVWTKTLWRPFQHYHTHAGAKVVTSAPGGWLQLRDGLDYSDGVRFPAAQFGQVAQSNTDRIQSIAAHFAKMGAVVQDVAAASASRHASRDRKGINNVGWRIWPYNYGKWITQLSPTTTSAGRWCVGNQTNLLGQNTRQTVPGQNMSFVLAPGLFADHLAAAGAAAAPATLYARVGFYDEGHGAWELHYASAKTSGAMKVAAHVQKNDTHEFVEIRVALADLDVGSHDGVSEHFRLVDADAAPDGAGLSGWTSADPDTFAWIEVLATPFLYRMAEVVRDLGTV